MVEGTGKPNDEVLLGPGPHEEFLELCAVSTSGSLSEEEQRKLREHLAVCSECREATKQYEAVVDHAIPALAPELAGETPEDPSFPQEAAEASFSKRLSEEDDKPRSRLGDAEPWLSPLVVRRSRSFRRSFDKYHFWVPLAAGLLLCTSLAILTFRMGKHRGIDVARREQGSARPGPALFQEALAVAIHDRDAIEEQLAAQDKSITELRREITQKSGENAKLKVVQSEQQAALQASDDVKKQLALERDRATQQDATDREALQASEKRLASLERERSEVVLRAASLEAKVAELARAAQDQERATSDLQELLAKDRDIRELMGARDLYVAEVHDVARTGETEKAFGRVFYTKGKSLIFYAYDLNDQPGLRQASTFQAWGRRGPDWNQAFKLGMFYEDNASKKRWVLKFNDKKTLDQIDAVFVTVEPHGGSERPTGKPLLFAYLKVAPNHP
jgi:Anti-sigma-K factor rskA/Putative zinc-finger